MLAQIENTLEIAVENINLRGIMMFSTSKYVLYYVSAIIFFASRASRKLFYLGDQTQYLDENIMVMPFTEGLTALPQLIRCKN